MTHADDHAVLQAWLEQYRLDKDPAKIQPSVAHFDKLLAALAKDGPASISGGTFTWCWCDALFMSPPVWAQLLQLTGDPKFFEWADREWWTTTDVLYDPQHRLYYRDNRYFAKRTPSGKKMFWARGNGWVVGGLISVLDHLPADHPSRGKYLGLYHDMMYALHGLQNDDGLWRTSLLDPQDPKGESSGSRSSFTRWPGAPTAACCRPRISCRTSPRAIRRLRKTSSPPGCSDSCRRSARPRTTWRLLWNPPRFTARGLFCSPTRRLSGCWIPRSAGATSPSSME